MRVLVKGIGVYIPSFRWRKGGAIIEFQPGANRCRARPERSPGRRRGATVGFVPGRL